MTINERIKMFRKSKGLSQKQFASSLGVTQSGVSYMEQDGSTVSDSSIKTICSVYGLNEEWLRNGTEPAVAQSDTFSLDQYLIEKGCTALELSIVKAYFTLDQSTRQKVFDYFQERLDEAKERAAAELGPPPPGVVISETETTTAPPLDLKSPVDMTDTEIDQAAEQIRQEMHREKEAVARSPVLPGSGMNSSGPPIGGSGGGAAGSATG